MVKKDIFDLILPDEPKDPDQFDDIEQEDTSVERLKKVVGDVLEQFDTKERRKEKRQLTDELKDFIRDEIAKIKPKQNVIERTIQTKVIEPKVVHVEPRVIEAPPTPPQIIKEVRVEVPAKDTRDLVEKSHVEALKKKIEDLEKKLAEVREMADRPIFMGGGPGVIGIPAPEPNPVGHVLTVNSDRKAEWKAATGGSGASLAGFTVNGHNELLTFDETDTSLDELARIVGTMIDQLQP
jgi:hypothetical protein